MVKEHTVRSFDEALGNVTGDILRMGRLSRDQLAAASELLDRESATDARAIEAADDHVDDLDQKIEQEVQRILALRQPMAGDLRALISCDRIATDLERIADHAKNIARRAASVAAQGTPVDFALTRELAALVLGQLDAILQAIEDRDIQAANEIWHRDETIDQAFDEAFAAQIEAMCQQPRTAASYTHALFIAKALERIGDHVTNIAEDLIYWVSGERLCKRSSLDAA